MNSRTRGSHPVIPLLLIGTFIAISCTALLAKDGRRHDTAAPAADVHLTVAPMLAQPANAQVRDLLAVAIPASASQPAAAQSDTRQVHYRFQF